MKITPLKFLWILIGVFFGICLILFVYIKIVIGSGMPSISQLENPKLNLATRIYSEDGVVLDHFYIERREDIDYDQIPKNYVNALVATEDRKFFKHWGVHTSRVLKAFVKNIFAGYAKEGGSTITMQLARNLYLSKENTLARKIREAFTAIQIERNYTKEQILQLYSNTVYFGRGAYGIAIASQVYFNKQPKDLTLSECAMLVALLKSPTNYDPVTNPEKAIARRDLVLSLMLQEGYILGSQYLEATKDPLLPSDRSANKMAFKNVFMIAPHFVELVRQTLSDEARLGNYDLFRDGLVINTTLNSRIQEYLNNAVSEHLKDLQANFQRNWSWSRNKNVLDALVDKAIRTNPNYRSANPREKNEIYQKLKNDRKFIDSVKNIATTIQVGAVVLDVHTGDILAMVGASPKFIQENPSAKYSLNHATQIRRQPGSSFKPFVYTAALMHGLTPYSEIECGPYTYEMPSGETWSPSGSGSCGPGEKRTLYSALAASINTVAARLITQVTNPDEVIRIAQKMGIKSPLVAYPALALGAGGDVSPIEMTTAFATFPMHGTAIQTRFLNDVYDNYGNLIIKSNKKTATTQGIIPDSIADEMISMMQGVVDYGTASIIRRFFQGVDAAGKTGTTDDAADAWFVGYTPDLVAGIWVGFDDKRVNFNYMGGQGYGGKAAAPIWGRLMAKIYSDPLLPYKKRSFNINKIAPVDTFIDSVGNSVPPQNNKQEAPALPPLPKR